MTTKTTSIKTTGTKTIKAKASNAKATKSDMKATTKATTKASTTSNPSGERLRKAAIAEIEHRLATADGQKQDHEVPSAKEVANTENIRTAAKVTTSVKAPKATKEPKPTKAPKPAKEPTPKKTSALDAAAIVLAGSAEPMGTKDLIEQMAARSLWTSPGGKTPEATLYAAILREIGTKKAGSRFTKVERGRFVAATKNATAGRAA